MSQKQRRAIIVIVCLILIMLFVRRGDAQTMYDCDARPISLVGSLEMGVDREGFIIQSFKIGGWQNNRPNGVTGFVGYGISLPIYLNGKRENEASLDTWFAELGWKQRISKSFFIHTYGGYNQIGKYIGLGTYIQCSDYLLSGLFYKQGVYGGTVYFKF